MVHNLPHSILLLKDVGRQDPALRAASLHYFYACHIRLQALDTIEHEMVPIW